MNTFVDYSYVVAIPTYNEELYIADAIKSLFNDCVYKKLRVVIIDAGSTDNTIEHATSVLRELHIKYEVLFNKLKLPAHGLNRVLLASNEDIFIRCDAHCLYKQGYLTGLVDVLLGYGRETIVTVGGCWDIKAAKYSGSKGNAISNAVSNPFIVGNILYRQMQESSEIRKTDTAPYSIFWTDQLKCIGGYDESLKYAEDDELNFRVLRAGGHVLLNPSSRAEYYARGTFRELCKQYFRYGNGKARVLLKLGKVATIRQLAPVINIIILIVAAVVSVIFNNPWSVYAYMIIYAGYLSLVSVIACNMAIVERIYFFVSAVIIQYCYGMGYLGRLILRDSYDE